MFVLENHGLEVEGLQSIDGFANFMHTILTKVAPDNLKACPRFYPTEQQTNHAKLIPSIEIPLLGTG